MIPPPIRFHVPTIPTATLKHAVYYHKMGATTGPGNVETGTPSLGSPRFMIDSQGNVTVQHARGLTVIQAALKPVADTSHLHGRSDELNDPCTGLFAFRMTSASSQQDVFVSFVDWAVLFSSFTAALPLDGGKPYDDLYGVGLKW